MKNTFKTPKESTDLVSETAREPYDLFIIGGGINGCGIARDAAGRGLSVGLAEMGDLGSGTSSASTKLFHGGLRYLEYFEISHVRRALAERETLLKAMPHISWPMRFVLPYHRNMRFETSTPASRILNFVMPWMRGRRPAWLIRIGLFFYDHLGGRKILPATKTVKLRSAPEGVPLKGKFCKAFEYSDCWVDDARLVILNARDADARGADILTRTKMTSASRSGNLWEVRLEDAQTQKSNLIRAKMIVNAAGPWVDDVIQNHAHSNSNQTVRLVKGSHIVTDKLYDHDKCYFFQGTDGRIIFAIPYETDFTLIGTTDVEHESVAVQPVCTNEEAQYLVDFANGYFDRAISTKDIVWTYSGVRPLYDDGKTSASAATRDYVLTMDISRGVPMLNIYGGKITAYRHLAEDAMEEVGEFFPELAAKWTAGVPLPGGDFPVNGAASLIQELMKNHPFLSHGWAMRLIKAYGTEAATVIDGAKNADDLGGSFGATLTETEVRWLMKNEYARTAQDIVWRRSKLGLRLTDEQINALDDWMKSHARGAAP